MRVLCLLILVAAVGALAIFAVENQQEITVTFWQWHWTTNVAVLAAVAFAAGMVGGWSILGLLRRSFNRVTTWDQQRAYR